MRGQPRKGGSGSLLTGCLPVPVQLVFAEERDLKVDLFTLSPLLFFFFFFFKLMYVYLFLFKKIIKNIVFLFFIFNEYFFYFQ